VPRRLLWADAGRVATAGAGGLAGGATGWPVGVAEVRAGGAAAERQERAAGDPRAVRDGRARREVPPHGARGEDGAQGVPADRVVLREPAEVAGTGGTSQGDPADERPGGRCLAQRWVCGVRGPFEGVG